MIDEPEGHCGCESASNQTGWTVLVHPAVIDEPLEGEASKKMTSPETIEEEQIIAMEGI